MFVDGKDVMKLLNYICINFIRVRVYEYEWDQMMYAKTRINCKKDNFFMDDEKNENVWNLILKFQLKKMKLDEEIILFR